ncbi:MAG: ribonuclease R [Bacteroidales bacterium]|nr:ribonuclease R [Bacteroidales bacterium]
MSKRKTLGRVRKRDERRKRGPAADARRPRGPVRERKREDYPEFEGTVQMTREGFCFVLVPEDPTKDIFVGSHRTRGALHGDRVRVAVTDVNPRTGKREGFITEVIERSPVPFVGILHTVGRQAWVLMQSRNMPYDIAVDYTDDLKSLRGMKVAALVDGWPKGESNPHGKIVDVLGAPGDNDTEMHAILAEYGLPYRFEKEVEAEAEAIPSEITPKDLKGRRDFRDTLTFTIDPADAKDFDDALSFRLLDDGNYEVGVHIADVSYYVRPGTLIDKEAQSRGTSVYLVDRTVPMLPEKLSNNLCSLRPDEDKLTFSAVFEISPLGKVSDVWFGRTVIRSDHRFDYDTAQKIIEGEKVEGVPGDLVDAILKFNALARVLKKRRFAAGAINFDRPEMEVEVDEKGKPVRVYERISKEANWLIEEFMLLANRSVAEYVATSGRMNGREDKAAKTFVYRIHDEPNMEKIQGLKEFALNFGYKMGETGNGGSLSKSLNGLLAQAKDKPEYGAMEMIALRAMAKACYSTDNIGHYGLAFKFYTHFTSPIRRYPDLMVHRLLSLYLGGGASQDRTYFSEQCMHASDREVVAADAERSSIKYKLVEFMQDKIGEEFDGHISGLTEWGMYVEIEPTHIEGMVSLREVRQDSFTFDEDHYRIVGTHTGKVYQLGDPVRIRVKSTNLEQKLLDYELVEPETEVDIPVDESFYVTSRRKRPSKRSKSGR